MQIPFKVVFKQPQLICTVENIKETLYTEINLYEKFINKMYII